MFTFFGSSPSLVVITLTQLDEVEFLAHWIAYPFVFFRAVETSVLQMYFNVSEQFTLLLIRLPLRARCVCESYRAAAMSVAVGPGSFRSVWWFDGNMRFCVVVSVGC